MASREKYIFHMLFGAFHITLRITFNKLKIEFKTPIMTLPTYKPK